jgi:hypothetical protein
MSSDGKALARDVFLAARKLPFEKVSLDEAMYGKDACLYVRSMTGKDRSEYEKRWMGRNAAKSPGAFRWDLLVRTVCNEEGELIFKEADGQLAMEQDASTIEDLFEAACFLNGLREKDVKDLAKNSESDQ